MGPNPPTSAVPFVGPKPLKFQVVSSQNGSVILKGSKSLLDLDCLKKKGSKKIAGKLIDVIRGFDMIYTDSSTRHFSNPLGVFITTRRATKKNNGDIWKFINAHLYKQRAHPETRAGPCRARAILLLPL